MNLECIFDLFCTTGEEIFNYYDSHCARSWVRALSPFICRECIFFNTLSVGSHIWLPSLGRVTASQLVLNLITQLSKYQEFSKKK